MDGPLYLVATPAMPPPYEFWLLLKALGAAPVAARKNPLNHLRSAHLRRLTSSFPSPVPGQFRRQEPVVGRVDSPADTFEAIQAHSPAPVAEQSLRARSAWDCTAVVQAADTPAGNSPVRAAPAEPAVQAADIPAGNSPVRAAPAEPPVRAADNPADKSPVRAAPVEPPVQAAGIPAGSSPVPAAPVEPPVQAVDIPADTSPAPAEVAERWPANSVESDHPAIGYRSWRVRRKFGCSIPAVGC